MNNKYLTKIGAWTPNSTKKLAATMSKLNFQRLQINSMPLAHKHAVGILKSHKVPHEDALRIVRDGLPHDVPESVSSWFARDEASKFHSKK